MSDIREQWLAWLAQVLSNSPHVHFVTRPDPWQLWAWVGLVRHRKRQAWVAEIVETRLSGDTALLGKAGGLAHPRSRPQYGDVPDLPEWRYFFHGIGCCLKNKVTGESIDVDFVDGRDDWIDVYFYANYLKSLREAPAPEARIIVLHRHLKSVVLTLSGLVECGFLEARGNKVRLVESDAQNTLIDRLCKSWETPEERERLEARLGDAFASGDTALRHILEERRVAQLDAILARRDGHARTALDALALWLPPSALEPRLLEVLESEDAGPRLKALSLLSFDKPSTPRLDHLIEALEPSASGRDAALFIALCKRRLARPGDHRALLERIVAFGQEKVEGFRSHPQCAEVALIALENTHPQSAALVRSTLRNGAPFAQQRLAAVLSLLAAPWCLRALTEMLLESENLVDTAASRAALLKTGDPGALRAVSGWMQAHLPSEDERDLGRIESVRVVDIMSDEAPEYPDAPLHNAMMSVTREREAAVEIVERLRALGAELDALMDPAFS